MTIILNPPMNSKTAYSCLNFMRRRTREENKVNDFQEIQADLIYTSGTNSKSLT